MPLLPNLPDIPQAQFDRVVASFPGDTNAQKTAAYRNWLTNRLIERVQMVESRKIEVRLHAEREAMLRDLQASLPPQAPEPDVP